MRSAVHAEDSRSLCYCSHSSGCVFKLEDLTRIGGGSCPLTRFARRSDDDKNVLSMVKSLLCVFTLLRRRTAALPVASGVPIAVPALSPAALVPDVSWLSAAASAVAVLLSSYAIPYTRAVPRTLAQLQGSCAHESRVRICLLIRSPPLVHLIPFRVAQYLVCGLGHQGPRFLSRWCRGCQEQTEQHATFYSPESAFAFRVS